MAKFNVTVTGVTTKLYSSIEVEADDIDEAKRIAEEMADEDEISADSEDKDFTSTATEVA